MNLFWLDEDMEICARYHNNKHVVKMTLETAQLLSIAHRVIDGNEISDKKGLYKLTHKNHPCSVWVRENNCNYQLAFSLFENLLKEYTFRYGKIHKSESKIDVLRISPCGIKIANNITERPCVMPEECIVKNNTIESHRNFYRHSKRDMAFWKDREIPYWWR